MWSIITYVRYFERHDIIQSFQIFEDSNLMWPQANRWSLKRAFICNLFRFVMFKCFTTHYYNFSVNITANRNKNWMQKSYAYCHVQYTVKQKSKMTISISINPNKLTFYMVIGMSRQYTYFWYWLLWIILHLVNLNNNLVIWAIFTY